MKKIITITNGALISLLFFGTPHLVNAQSSDFLFKIPNPFSGQIKTFNDLIDATILFLYYLAGPVVVVMIVYSGLMFLWGRGEPAKIKTAKDILFYALIGLAIILIGNGFVVLLKSILALGG